MAYSKVQLAQVHFFEWYGRDGLSPKESILKYGIAAKCLHSKGVALKESEYDCYVPDPDDEDCCIRFRVSNDLLVRAVRSQTNLAEFLQYNNFLFKEFKDMDITDKFYYVCEYYDVMAILNLVDPLTYLKEEIQF